MDTDLNFGSRQEDIILKKIQEKVNPDFVKTPQHHPYDYTDGETYIELKSRRCKHNSYPDTMIGYNKLKYAINRPDKEFIFLFNFQDGIYKHKFNPKKNYKIKDGGRCDRGKIETAKYAYIPLCELEYFNL